MISTLLPFPPKRLLYRRGRFSTALSAGDRRLPAPV
jgi:hypothetical protein